MHGPAGSDRAGRQARERQRRAPAKAANPAPAATLTERRNASRTAAPGAAVLLSPPPCASSTIAAISPSSSTSKLPRASPGRTSTRSMSPRVISSARRAWRDRPAPRAAPRPAGHRARRGWDGGAGPGRPPRPALGSAQPRGPPGHRAWPAAPAPNAKTASTKPFHKLTRFEQEYLVDQPGSPKVCRDSTDFHSR